MRELSVAGVAEHGALAAGAVHRAPGAGHHGDRHHRGLLGRAHPGHADGAVPGPVLPARQQALLLPNTAHQLLGGQEAETRLYHTHHCSLYHSLPSHICCDSHRISPGRASLASVHVTTGVVLVSPAAAFVAGGGWSVGKQLPGYQLLQAAGPGTVQGFLSGICQWQHRYASLD